MTYYLKYRSKTLDEIDLTDVRESLKKLVASGNIPHALLFSGPKGTGKTSAARILAKIVNCEANGKKLKEPCNKCDQCVSITKGTNIDVVELDAASHRGIDDVRALRDAVKLAPAKARRKVYIIDEAHMLTLEASNALLKTLEEPPEHVFFILATTNPEKLIETIRSRAVNIVFKKGSIPEIERSLERVIAGEKIKIDKEAVRLIAEKSEGSFRDAQKVLEEMVSEKRPLDSESVKEFLFNRKILSIEELVTCLTEKDTKKALGAVEDAFTKGASLENLTDELLARLRKVLLAKIGITLDQEDLLAGWEDTSSKELIYLIELFTKASFELKDAVIEQLPVEIAIIEWCEGKKGAQPQSVRLSQNSSPKGTGSAHIHSIGPSAPGQTASPLEEERVREVKEITEEVWKAILAKVKPINTVVEALLRAAKPLNYDGKTLTLGVFYRFHKERLEVGQHRRILEDVVAGIVGAPVKVVCMLTEPPKPTASERKTEEPKEKETVLTEGEDKDIIKVAEEIFGN